MPRNRKTSSSDREVRRKHHRKSRRRSSSSSSRSRSRSPAKSSKVERWPKDGYKELESDFSHSRNSRDFRDPRDSRDSRGGYRDRRNGGGNQFGEEYLAHRRSQREEICERGAPEVWGRSPAHIDLYSETEQNHSSDVETKSKKSKKFKKSKKSHP